MTNGFNVPLVSFVTGTNVDPIAMNNNFQALNLANTFTGTFTTFSSDGGKLTSDGNGNLFVAGGKLGVVVAGDRIDAGTTPGTLYLSGPNSISIQISGSEGGSITPAGLSVGSGKSTPTTSSSNSNSSSTVTQNNSLAFGFLVGTLRYSNLCTGNGMGTFNHGLQTTPTFAFAETSSIAATGMGVNAPTSSTIFVYPYIAGKAWTLWAIAY